jgi:hypothetical protein
MIVGIVWMKISTLVCTGFFLLLALFNVRGDGIWSSSFFGFSTHGYSPFFLVSPLKNKVMEASGDRLP